MLIVEDFDALDDALDALWAAFMRDIFDDIFKNEPLDPMESARRSVRVNLRKRFYKAAGVDRQLPSRSTASRS